MRTADDQIDERIGEVRTRAVDLSLGEIVNLHSNRELVIRPEYQRLFRWSDAQRSRLIESILVELPIPQIFVVENQDGVLELVDGLQRISSVIQFINPRAIGLDPLRLQGCDLITDLNNKTFEELSSRLQLRVKRSSVRAIVIRRQSRSFLRYELFKRLNTGGSMLTAQEIRNCSARMAGDDGIDFYAFLQQCVAEPAFAHTTESLPETDREQRGDEELVLRFFAVKNGRGLFRGSVRDWLDAYMEKVIFHGEPFDNVAEKETFNRLFGYLDRVLGSSAFVKYRGTTPIGGLAPAHFESVTMGVHCVLDELDGLPTDTVKNAIVQTVQSEAFRRFTGPGANSKEKLVGRISAMEGALRHMIDGDDVA